MFKHRDVKWNYGKNKAGQWIHNNHFQVFDTNNDNIPSTSDGTLTDNSRKHGNDDDGLQNGSPAVEESPPGPSIDGQMDAESSDATVIDVSHSAQENVKEEDNARRSIKTDKSKNSNNK